MEEIYFTYTPLLVFSNYINLSKLEEITLDIIYIKDYNVALGSCTNVRKLLLIKPLLLNIISKPLAEGLIELYINNLKIKSEKSKKAYSYLQSLIQDIEKQEVKNV